MMILASNKRNWLLYNLKHHVQHRKNGCKTFAVHIIAAWTERDCALVFVMLWKRISFSSRTFLLRSELLANFCLLQHKHHQAGSRYGDGLKKPVTHVVAYQVLIMHALRTRHKIRIENSREALHAVSEKPRMRLKLQLNKFLSKRVFCLLNESLIFIEISLHF